MAFNPYLKTSGIGEAGVSNWHSAQFINQRLNNIWVQSKNHFQAGRLKELNHLLDVAWTELCPDATKEQRAHMKRFEEKIFENEASIKLCKNRTELINAQAKYSLEVYHKWLYLKLLEKKQGLGKSYRDKFEDDFD